MLLLKTACAAAALPRPWKSFGSNRNQPATSTVNVSSSEAGMIRRARRAQNWTSENVPVSISLTTSEVMRNPEMTKKISTPTYPPGTPKPA